MTEFRMTPREAAGFGIMKVLGGLVGAAVALQLLAILSALPAGAAIIIVPDDNPSIRAAVESAAPGDTIQVRPGTFNERIKIRGGQTGLTIEGLGGRPVIDPGGEDAIRVKLVDNVTVRGLEIVNARAAVRFDDCVGCTAQDLVIQGSIDGVRVKGGSGAVVSNVVVNGTTRGRGVRIEKTSGATVSGCTVTNPHRDGIRVRKAPSATLTGNTVSGASQGRCIRIDKSPGATLNGNTVSGCLRDGIRVVRSDNVSLDGNSANGNGGDGVRVVRSVGAAVQNTTADANGRSGIRIQKSTSLTLATNTASNNAEYGFWVRQSPPVSSNAAVTGAGNTASGNVLGDVRVD